MLVPMAGHLTKQLSPESILLGFMHSAEGDSPHLRFLSPYKDASYSSVTAEQDQGI